ncbi:MAG: DUF4012 domain-containing protein [Patescibacteria group bacterium]
MQDEDNNQEKKGRGRPKKILTPEEVLALKNKPSRGRGRPKKVLTPEEILALKNKTFRGRGRPKKELTAEELEAIKLSKERGRGRPQKRLSPREEWLMKFSPKREKGRPKKDEILEVALPRIIFLQKEATVIEHEVKEKVLPKLSWQEFKEKIKLPDISEDYVFPIIEEEKVAPVVNKGIRRVKVRQPEAPSEYVLDLRNGGQVREIVNEEVVDRNYAWEKTEYTPMEELNQKDLSLLNFTTPDDVEDDVMEFTKVEKRKNRRAGRKVSLISRQEPVIQKPVVIRKEKVKGVKVSGGVMDKSLNSFGKFLYFVWKSIVAPFKFLDFVVDRTLKGIWWGIVQLFKLPFKVVKLNYIYLKRLVSSLVNKDKVPVRVSIKPILSFLVVAFIIVVPFAGYNLYQKANNIKGNVLGVSADGVSYLKDAADTIASNDLDNAWQKFEMAESSFRLAQDEVNSLGAFNTWMMKLVPKVNDGQKILRAGELAAVVGREVTNALGVFNGKETSNTIDKICQSLPGEGQKCSTFVELDLTDRLGYVKNILEQQKPNIDELVDILASIDIDSVPAEYQENLIQVKQNIAGLENMTNELSGLLDFLLSFLGAEEPKRYLVIFQNTREARATGGFMGSFAVVDIKHGNVEKMDIPGGGLYDLKGSNQVLVEAPKPLQIMSPVWQIWNANWYPDWPTSAEKIMWFYENNTGGSSVDGVIALNQDVVANLLEHTGPIEMEEYEKTLSADNFVGEVQAAVEFEYDKEENKPKQIIADLAPELLQRIISLDQKTFLKTFLILNTSLEQEKVLFYFNDEKMQSQIEKYGWSGKMKKINENQDYLMVVHTNISGGKTEDVIENEIDHKVEVGDDGSLLATVTLRRTHNGDITKIFEADNNVDYVRFYVPEGSKFVSAKGFNFNPSYLFKYAASEYENLSKDETVAETEANTYIDESSRTRIGIDSNRTVYGNWIQVAPGQEVVAEIKYVLPFKFEVNDESSNFKKWISSLFSKDKQYKYSMIVEKHPGMDTVDFSSQLVVPEDWDVKKVIKSSNISQDKNIFNSSLLTDGYYGVILED